MDIHIKIDCPDLVSAAGILAEAWGLKPQQAAPVPSAQAPVHPQPPVQAPAAPTVPAPAAVPTTAPVTGPSYTVQDLAVAGANLIQENPSAHPQLMGLLGQFGVRAVTDLKPEHLGPFANAMRQMGAKL